MKVATCPRIRCSGTACRAAAGLILHGGRCRQAPGLVLALLLVLAMTSVSCLQAQNVPAAAETPAARSGAAPALTPRTTPAASEWEKVVAEARKEGEVMMYTSIKVEARNALSEAFKAKYGIQLGFLVGKGAELSPRILSERGAGLYLADMVNAGGTTLLQSLKPRDVFVDIRSELMLPEVLDPEAWLGRKVPFIDKDRTTFSMIATPYRAIMRNTQLVGETELTTYRDLLNPKWKDKKITMYDPTVPGGATAFVALLVQDWGLEPAKEFLRGLAKQDPVITRDVNVQLKDVAQGKYPLAISPHVETAGQMIAVGAPVAYVKVTDAVIIK